MYRQCKHSVADTIGTKKTCPLRTGALRRNKESGHHNSCPIRCFIGVVSKWTARRQHTQVPHRQLRWSSKAVASVRPSLYPLRVYHLSTHSESTISLPTPSLPSLYPLRVYHLSTHSESTISLPTPSLPSVYPLRVYHLSTHSESTICLPTPSLPSLYPLRVYHLSTHSESTISLPTPSLPSLYPLRVYHLSTHSESTISPMLNVHFCHAFVFCC